MISALWKSRSEKSLVDELQSPKMEMRRGVIVAVVFFVGVLGWAAFIPLDSGAVAQGSVAVSGNRQSVQHRDGGIITELPVIEGQLVKKGDILVRISASELVAAERGMAGEMMSLLAQRARLDAERTGAGAMKVPAEFASLSEQDKVLANDAMRSQRLLFSARRDALSTQRSVLGQQIKQHRAQISAFDQQMSANGRQQTLIGEELTGLDSLVEKGFVSINRIRAMKRGAAELEGNYGSLQADKIRVSESIGETRLTMVSIDRKMLEDVATEMQATQLRLDELQPRLYSTREQLARAMVRAPASGKVVGLNVHTVGGVVSPGQTLMEIVPVNRDLVIEAKVQPSDADDLRVGMPTQIRFSALHERTLPTLMGKINKLSADSFEDERTGQHYFTIEIQVPLSELEKVRRVRGENVITAGLPAEVIVPLKKRTALSYLLDPITEMLWMSGREQ
jgi:HlyD family type I secretion membrane fusion protein